jgi:rSAM/selenodomain-associated transferase 2
MRVDILLAARENPTVLSVIIPTLNEAANLPRTLAHTQAAAVREAIELIVSDCCSEDETRRVAAEQGARVIEGSLSRAQALNRGAAAARGGRLLFLHADTLLPTGFAVAVRQTLDRPEMVGGAFNFRFFRPPELSILHWKLLGVIALMNNVRFRTSRNFYGDQAIFVRRSVFERLGGFPERPLLEDLHFSRRMKRVGGTSILSPAVHSSARRFLARGIIHQMIQDIRLILADSLGMRPGGLAMRYNGWNQRQFRATPIVLMHEV